MSEKLFGSLEEQFKLPSGLLNAVMMQESGGRADAVSKKGAKGYFQFMPDTAKQYGVDPSDLTSSATGAARMYSDLLKKYGGDVKSALAGYNWGQGNVDKFGLEKMPSETRDYIARITAKMQPKAPTVETIDASKVKWDEQPIDVAKVQWDEPAKATANDDDSFWRIGRVSPEREAAIRGERERKSAEADKRAKSNITGIAHGFADIGDAILNIGQSIAPESVKRWNDERTKTLAALAKGDDSFPFQVGRVGGNVAATYPVGGMLGWIAKTAGFSPAIVSSLSTSGFRTGAAPTTLGGHAANAGTRAVGGGVTGGASAGLVNQDDAGTGALLGAALPGLLSTAGRLSSYIGKNTAALVRPFTDAGQTQMAANIVKKFGEDGPMAINAKELVPGSSPTLAEATGNAGIARLQSATRDIKPNAFVDRETANAAARLAAVDDVAGDAGKLEFFKGERSDTAKKLYREAMEKGVDQEAATAVKGQVAELLKRPSIKKAAKEARGLAAEDGLKLTDETSLQGLHYTKLSLDQQINEAMRAGNTSLARSLMGTKDLLESTMTKMSPAYAEARVTFAEMSKPINQMEVLQNLKLVDSKGNITLTKIQNALSGLEAKMSGPGTNAAKSLTDEQIGVLRNVRDDLLRQTKGLSAGKSAGSPTFQNTATDEILNQLLPGQLGKVANPRVSTLVGRAGNVIYGGANEKIRSRLVDMMLDPAYAETAMQPSVGMLGNAGARARTLADFAAPHLLRSAPALSTSQ